MFSTSQLAYCIFTQPPTRIINLSVLLKFSKQSGQDFSPHAWKSFTKQVQMFLEILVVLRTHHFAWLEIKWPRWGLFLLRLQQKRQRSESAGFCLQHYQLSREKHSSTCKTRLKATFILSTRPYFILQKWNGRAESVSKHTRCNEESAPDIPDTRYYIDGISVSFHQISQPGPKPLRTLSPQVKLLSYTLEWEQEKRDIKRTVTMRVLVQNNCKEP